MALDYLTAYLAQIFDITIRRHEKCRLTVFNVKNIQIQNSNVLGLPRLREMSTRQPVIWETRLLNSVYKELKFCFMPTAYLKV